MMYFNELILPYFGSGVHQFPAPALVFCGYAAGNIDVPIRAVLFFAQCHHAH